MYPPTNRAERMEIGSCMVQDHGRTIIASRLSHFSANFNLGQRRESNTLWGACLAISVRIRTEPCDFTRVLHSIYEGPLPKWPFSAFSHRIWLGRSAAKKDTLGSGLCSVDNLAPRSGHSFSSPSGEGNCAAEKLLVVVGVRHKPLQAKLEVLRRLISSRDSVFRS